MRILLSGSQSFIGREFRRQAAASGHDVVGLDSLPSAHANDVTCDIRDPALSERFPCGINAVVHLAAISRESDCRQNPGLAIEVNTTGTLNLFRVAARAGARQFLFASSEWVYGQCASGAEQRESDSISLDGIDSVYALTKATTERLLWLEAKQSACAITVLRFAIVYGPRPSNWAAIEQLFFSIRDGNPIRVGSLATARRFIHVTDVAAGIGRTLGRSGFEIFNLAGERLITLRDIVETGSRLWDRTVPVEETNPTAAVIRNPSPAKARESLNWCAAIGLEDGLKSLMAAM